LLNSTRLSEEQKNPSESKIYLHIQKYRLRKQKMENIQKENDKRIKPRKLYSGHILFVTKNGFYEGRLKNYSRSGLFIETKASLSVGEIITIALPYQNHSHAKCKGQIIWCNKEGFGVELFKKRNAAYLKIIK